MEPCAPGTEDEPRVPIFPVKKNNETERLLAIKTRLPNGTYGNVFELTNHPANGSESWYCHVCTCPVMGPVFQHEVGRRHNMNISRTPGTTNVLKLAPGEPVPPGFEGEIEKIAQIQESLDNFQMGPLIGLEYLVEIQEYDHENKEPSYLCMLCDKRGDPRTVMAHLVSYNHRLSYLQKHFPATWRALAPYSTRQYKRGWQLTIHKISEAIESKFGRLKPISVERDLFERKRVHYNEAIAKTDHFDERQGVSFEGLVDGDAIKKAAETTEQEELEMKRAAEKEKEQANKRQYRKSGTDPGADSSRSGKRSPSPPVVAKPTKKGKTAGAGAGAGRRSLSSVSSISSSSLSSVRSRSRSKSPRRRPSSRSYSRRSRTRSPYYRRRGRRTRSPSPYNRNRRYSKDRYRDRDRGRDRRDSGMPWQRSDYQRPRSDYESGRNSKPKMDKIDEFKKQCLTIEADMDRVLKQHEKNPEKHPQYNDEWKKFWNRRYKELQADGKDASTHDFKPEWIDFWNKRMTEMHNAEVKTKKDTLRKRLNLPDEPAPISFKILGKKKGGSSAGGGSMCKTEDLNTDAVSDTSLEAPAAPEPEVIIIDEDKDEDTRSHSTKRSHSPWEADSSGPRSKSRTDTHSKFTDWRKDSPPLNSSSDMMFVRERDFDPYKPPRIMREATRKPVLSPPRGVSVSAQSEEDGEVNVIGVLRLLTALEEHMGSLGPKIIDLLSQALALEKAEPNSAETLLDNEVNCVLLETVKEKLKGLSDDRMGIVGYSAKKRFKIAITKIASLMHFASERKKAKLREFPRTDPIKVPGIGTVDKAAIAKQIANALIMQGKTDVTQAELEQLIDAVVGMAQASQGSSKPITTANFLQNMTTAAATPSSTTITSSALSPKPTVEEPSSVSALQMLQGAYSGEATSTMDGLSDSDLQTLLQNFKDLSTEEQHGLITYLKKLESKEPERVERLRKFVNLGSHVLSLDDKSGRRSPFSNRLGGTNPDSIEICKKEKDDEQELTDKLQHSEQIKQEKLKIDSDDDDYSFEDVFKAASNNLKEKELEEKEKIVKESISQPDTNLMDAKTLIANIIGQFGDNNIHTASLLGLASSLPALQQSITKSSSVTNSTVSMNQPVLPANINLSHNKPLVQYPITTNQQQQQYPMGFNQQNFSNPNGRQAVVYPTQGSFNRPFNNNQPVYQDNQNRYNTPADFLKPSVGQPQRLPVNAGGYMGQLTTNPHNNQSLRNTNPNQFQVPRNPNYQQQFGGNRNFY